MKTRAVVLVLVLCCACTPSLTGREKGGLLGYALGSGIGAGIGAAAVHWLGGSLVVLRVLHAWGLGTYEGANYPRLIGAQGTFLLLSVLGVTAVYQFLHQG